MEAARRKDEAIRKRFGLSPVRY
nr:MULTISPECIES: DUF3263 domain-containing protein [unclassified Mycobacteroides]